MPGGAESSGVVDDDRDPAGPGATDAVALGAAEDGARRILDVHQDRRAKLDEPGGGWASTRKRHSASSCVSVGS